MAFTLERLMVAGPGKEPAIIDLSRPASVIYGPSETGKSYVYHCIAYCLGSDEIPEEIPQAHGYQSIYLEICARRGAELVADETDKQDEFDWDAPQDEFEFERALDQVTAPEKVFTIVRGIQGGSEAIYRSTIEGTATARKLKLDCNELMKRLVGVSENVVFKKAGKKGHIAAGPLRHWSLLSQTSIVAKDNVLGDSNTRTERSAALALMLTGVDDAAIETGVSTDERRAAAGGVDAVYGMIQTLQADIPEDAVKKDVEEALSRVDETLKALSEQQKSRAQALETVRSEIARVSGDLRKRDVAIAQSAGLESRFRLLQAKYQSDFARLVSLDEGAAVYNLLDNVPCPLCGTTMEKQAKESLTSPEAANKQRRAISAEAKKIEKQRAGLEAALRYETKQLIDLKLERKGLQEEFERYGAQEKRMIASGIDEFKVSATDLARRRTELYTQVRAFEEIARLTGEAARLQTISATKNARIERQVAGDGLELSELIKQLLHEWGFESVRQVAFDASTFDITVDGRRRTSFGQGVRALFLAAYYIALLQYVETAGRPHPGFVVVDSPLKSFADQKQEGDPDVPLVTVNTKFYNWLASWKGPGQLIVLENEEPPAELRPTLDAIEFTKIDGVRRRGFFP